MRGERLKDLITRAQAGDEAAREKLIRSFRPFIAEVAAGQCKRKLEWENDDELSIGLLAFNQAIDSYDASFDKKFQNYAAMLIRSRLIDYFRKESRHRHLSLDGGKEETADISQWEAGAAWEKYREEQETLERAQEMAFFQQTLKSFGISFPQLVGASPSHRDTRDRLVAVAELIAERKNFKSYLNSKKKLPLKELAFSCGVSRKVLKQRRHYIIALFLIVSRDEFSGLRSLFSLGKKGLPEEGQNLEGGKIDG